MKTQIERIEELEKSVDRIEKIHLYGAMIVLIAVPFLLYIRAKRS